MIHGITIRNRASKELVEFIKCPVGRQALMVLSGVRRNLGSDYDAQEDFITTEEFSELEARSK